jgi:hypothetical protein
MRIKHLDVVGDGCWSFDIDVNSKSSAGVIFSVFLSHLTIHVLLFNENIYVELIWKVNNQYSATKWMLSGSF